MSFGLAGDADRSSCKRSMWGPIYLPAARRRREFTLLGRMIAVVATAYSPKRSGPYTSNLRILLQNLYPV